jgi:membrane protein implicated in regulation of membrane protease activity
MEITPWLYPAGGTLAEKTKGTTVIWLLVLILLLAAMGVLGFVVKVAFAVALGVVIGFVVLAAVLWWRVRRALFGPRYRWRRVKGAGGSTVEVLDRPSPRD